MANGPPTPPPTTATEIQDEARTSAPQVSSPSSSTITDAPAPQAAAPSAPLQDSYQLIFPEIVTLASQSNWQELIRVAETSDLNGNGDGQISGLLVTVPLVLAYLIQDELPAARFALIRLPANLQTHPLIKELFGLLTVSWERKHAQVYSRSENLLNETSKTQEEPLAPIVAGMIAAFIESFRIRTFALLSKAYTSLPLSLAQTYIGLPTDRLLSAAETFNWSYDASTQILRPKSSTGNGPTPKSIHTSSSLSTFDFVSNSVAKLEM